MNATLPLDVKKCFVARERPELTAMKLWKRSEECQKLGIHFLATGKEFFDRLENKSEMLTNIACYWAYDQLREKKWPLYDASFSLGEPRRYFEAIPTILTHTLRKEIDEVLSLGSTKFSVDQLNRIIKSNLFSHEMLIDSLPELASALVAHTGAASNLDSSSGRIISASSPPDLSEQFVTWRCISRHFEIQGKSRIGDRSSVEKSGIVWSTSYDPLASIAFCLSDEKPEREQINLLKLTLPKGFAGGWFVENAMDLEGNFVMKNQFEYSIFRGEFVIANISVHTILLPTSGEKEEVKVKLFELDF